MSAPSTQTIRRYVMTASVAAITATGAWYGAGLKSRQEVKQETQKALQVTPAEKIEHLESIKVRFLRQKTELQGKIDRLTAQDSTSGSPDTTQKQYR